MRTLYVTLMVMFFITRMFAQIGVNSDGANPDNSAMLDVKSANKGFLMPRMSQGEIKAIPNPANGLQVFCTTDSKIYIFITSINKWKEVAYGTGTLAPAATYTIGTGGSCSNTVVYGNFYNGFALSSINYVTIQISVSVIGSYSINTNTINGYSFSATGDFSSTGTQTINLAGSGTPISAQTDNFTVTSSNGGGSCTFSITVNLWTCGTPITINHVASGGVAPVDKSVTYESVDSVPGVTPSKCWFARNLGASNQATSVSDATEAAAGWYWQFNRKQGYKHDGTTRTPNTTWIINISENNNWLPVNDPCTLEIGNGWRLPTSTEWTNVDGTAGGNWTNWNGPYTSLLKMHAAGRLNYYTGSIESRGTTGYYWSSNTTAGIPTMAYVIWFNSSSCAVSSTASKVQGSSIRCIKD